MIYKSDCRHFLGHIPCKFHKKEGVHCSDCKYYDKTDKKILIIKLGAIGDVIRTTTLLPRIKKEYPTAQIWWITYSPDIVPSLVDKVFNYNAETLAIMQEVSFDVMINLDKDIQACALANIVRADKKFGFILKDGVPAPANELAEHKFVTGLFDDVNKANRKSYPEEIFEICGWQFAGEDYLLDCDKDITWDYKTSNKPVIGLNTGCGARWVSRLWANEKWEALIAKIHQAGYQALLLGGKQEDENNILLQQKTGATYLGYYSLPQFISLVDTTDVVVSAVTMGMHIAIGLKKPLVLMNNIFNPYEFELYGRGEIVQPRKECTCYFSPKCSNKEYFCMDHLEVDDVFEAINRSIVAQK